MNRPRPPLGLAAAFTVVAALSEAHAESVADAPQRPLRYAPELLDRAEKGALYRRNTGIGLAVPGVALTVLGSVLLVNGAQSVNLFGGGAQLASGTVMAGLGLALAIPGVVLWVGGQDAIDVVSWRRRQQAEADAPPAPRTAALDRALSEHPSR